MPFRHLDQLLEIVEPLAVLFEEADHRLYLVGGIVRDQWLDEPVDASADLDLTTDAPPAVIKELVADRADAVWTQGERFGTIGAHIASRAFEITTHRSEAYQPDSRKPAVTFGDDIAVDLSRRDFTVNAMAVQVPTGTLVDPWGGASDLEAGLLRTPLDPTISFSDDPLRMLRAARFAAKYGLTPSAELIAAARSLRHRLEIVAIERIGAELERLLDLPAAGVGATLLVDMGLAEVLLGWQSTTPLDAATIARLPQAAAAVGRLDRDWRTRLACLLLVAFDDPVAAADAAGRLRLSRDDARFVDAVADRAAAAVGLATTSDRASDAGVRAWWLSSRHHDAALAAASVIDERVASVADDWIALRDREQLDEPQLLTGSEIMATLDLEAGPEVGEAVAALRQHLIDHGPVAAAEQRAHVRIWWSDRNPG